MTDLRPEESLDVRLTSKATEHLAEHIYGLVQRWEQKRDVEYESRWKEYRRLWMGEWAPQDRDRDTERSHAIMPAIQQAVDSAVSEVEEAVFGQERWFDLPSDDPSTPQDEGEPGRQLADQLLADLRPVKAAISETVLLGAVYGTGIGKIVINQGPGETIIQELVPIEPMHFVIDDAANTIEEAEGCAHVFHMPYHMVLERQRQGIYDQVDPRIGTEPGDERHVDSMTVRIIEYQGLVPASMLPDVEDDREKLSFEDDKPVEAIVTIANDNVVLRATQNPFDRGFVAFPWDTVPNSFWGRGIVEKGYWPQKVLDAEVRSRIDSLGLATVPMMGINAAAIPRGADFKIRPGRNIFLNGNPNEVMSPIQFPPPDPQTYTQGQEMQRMIEMATGQLQAATPFGVNGRNETASGMSMMLGASIRRTRRTMANLDRQFMQPFLGKVIDRFVELDVRYPQPVAVEINGTLGMMAREFESMQLGQLLNAMPPGPAQFMILRSVVDNMALKNRQDLIRLLDLLTAQALEPQEPQRDLGGEARMLSAQTRAVEVQSDNRKAEAQLLLEAEKLKLQRETAQANHRREIMRLSVDAERQESDEVAQGAKAILDLAKASEARATEIGDQVEAYKRTIAELQAQASAPPAEVIDLSDIRAELEALKANVPTEAPGLSNEDIAEIRIERDGEGLLSRVNGRSVTRDERGLIMGLS